MTQNPLELSETFARIAQTLRSEGDVQHTLERTVTLAVATLPCCDFAGVSMLQPGNVIETPAATSEVAAQADRLQYELGEGPCLQSLHHRRTVRIDDLPTDPRWPRWGPRAADLGIRAIRCFPLHLADRTLGALNLYAESPAAFEDEDDAVGSVFAAHAAMALATALSEQGLTAALENRNVIGQAQGILIERHRLTSAQAFEVLRRASQSAGLKLSEIARTLVETGDVP
jgi:GAF domain-containing protein